MDTTIPEQPPADSAPTPEPAQPRMERLRRPEPRRTGPVRDASGYFRDSRSWGEEAHPAWREPSDMLDDTVTRGVTLGYRVIDEHLRRGRHTAAKMRSAETDEQTDDREIEELIDRLQRVYKDAGALCLDALEVIARSPALLRWLSGKEQQRAPGGATPTASTAGAPASAAEFAIEVSSRQRARVNLNLPAGGCGYVPAAHALYAADPGIPPLTQVVFRHDPACTVPVLAVEIPDLQPPGLYTGVVVDQATNEPKGTLSVRILP